MINNNCNVQLIRALLSFRSSFVSRGVSFFVVCFGGLVLSVGLLFVGLGGCFFFVVVFLI